MKPATSGESSPLAGMRSVILIVEDDPETRRLYQHILEPHGFRVEQAHNGHQALDKALASPPDLIETGIAVPGIDGIELRRRLRAEDRTKAVPVLAITAYGNREYPDRTVRAGANQVMFEPCQPDVLVAQAPRLLHV